uniref:Uncharacterized protein n=1 Tax=Anguilla anguilla TaxID=7936 RepID=A0A0E9UMP7_ANGAN
MFEPWLCSEMSRTLSLYMASDFKIMSSLIYFRTLTMPIKYPAAGT